EIEHAVWSAWHEQKPEFIVIEGQGSLLNPAYPGGYEIIAAGRPDAIILQHAPLRKEYDGFPGYKLHDLKRQIEAVEVISEKPVIAITVNHEDMKREEIPKICAELEDKYGLPTADVLVQGADKIVRAVLDAEQKLRKTK
ncbi:NAD-dependent epimerase/dehydratase family protein, partial [bacterium]|nr:NAD-dependent epimerase/dehydratase family protein [bacterium]